MTTFNQPTADSRASLLRQDIEFMRYMTERRADAEREADRCQHEIDTMMASIEAKRLEQDEYLRIVDACSAAGAVIEGRPAPKLTGKKEEAQVEAPK